MTRGLPLSWVHYLKKLHFPTVLRNVSENDWPYAHIARHLIDPGDKVVDIGANVGYVTALLARYVGNTGRVYSFEPVAETYALLTHSLRKLQITNVETYCYALSSAAGFAHMQIPRFPDGSENFYESHIVDDSSAPKNMREVSVEMRRLDDVLAEHVSDIVLAKIDVEGHELGVIEGGLRILRKSHPALIVEVSGSPDEQDSRASQVFAALAACEYTPWLLDGRSVRRRHTGEQAVDYFFLGDRHVSRLRQRGALIA